MYIGVPHAQSAGQTPEIAVYYGGFFSQEQAENLVGIAVWLEALENAATQLSEHGPVRLAGLDNLQRQGLAALLSIPWVSLHHEGPSPERPDDSEPKIIGEYSLQRPDTNEIPLWLAQAEQYQRQTEVIAALRPIVAEALDLADRGHNLRIAPAPKSDTFSHISDQSPDLLISNRLNWLMSQIDAYTLYRHSLENYIGIWDNPEQALDELEQALVLAPGALPFLVSQGEILLHLDRPSAALRSLEQLSSPVMALAPPWQSPQHTAYTPEDKLMREQARTAANALYVRGLRLRAMVQLSLGHSALAESDLNIALTLAPEEGELWLSRGAVRQTMHQYEAMCADYYQACSFGFCDGLAAARTQGYCSDNSPPSLSNAPCSR